MQHIQEFNERKKSGQKISMVTCYDYWSAKLISSTQVDCVLVGDSLAMVMQGYESTLPAEISTMALHTSSVARGLKNKFIIADLPFLSFRKTLAEGISAAEVVMKAGAHAVKLEGAKGNLDLVRHLVDSGVPVMGHLGLTPQSVNQLGGYKVQGKSAEQHLQILKDAKDLAAAGCFAIVLECVPAKLAEEITAGLPIPTIGIGAGIGCNGQVLVLHDMLGLQIEVRPKFVRRYLQGYELLQAALNDYHKDVQSGTFPTESESYL